MPILFEDEVVLFQESSPRHHYGWDISFSGAAEDYLAPLGIVSLPEDGTRLGQTLLCYPLRSWTEEGLARYASEHGIAGITNA